ncbi:DUF2617 family protein [Thermobifida cellulosilytica]|uniref:DUF2617 domain-containing protein n=1 Tax=Thermobifida cellulosilytica TB100 TaxID=665004 RepID=A0A147KEC6_THECS|nr:DUF2617 family protein [Thermobifida cellulosilytica]KUP95620.1 hypothetical protein AC529_16595 [Thermobifida cellulosilytica TB100]
MHVAVDVPFSDTRAADLAWSITHPPVEPLVARTLHLAGARVELRVLGASHQVVVAHGRARFVETVACLPDVSGGLPATAEPHVPGTSHYRFASSVRRLGPAEFAARATAVRDRLVGRPDALSAVFPGNPLAITALLAAAAGPVLHWQTWHAYPQSGELVATVSTTVLAPRPSGRETRHGR